MSRIFLFVIDGLGVFNSTEQSTLSELISKTGLNLEKDLPFLNNNGLSNSLKNNGYSMLQKSIESGSFIGHQEMFGNVFLNSYDIPNNPIESTLIEKHKQITGISLIGNEQGRGNYLIPKFHAEHLKSNSIMLYRGYDSTIVLAAERKKISLSNFKMNLNTFRELIDNFSSLKIKKVLGRHLHNQETIKKVEVFPKLTSEIENLFDSNWYLYLNRKIWDIFRPNTGRVINTVSDSQIYKFLRTAIKSNYHFKREFYFFNFEDFDKYAHLGNTLMCKNALVKLDNFLSKFHMHILEDDWIIITADHGVRFIYNDLSECHKVENVPLLVIGNPILNIDLSSCKDGHGYITELLRKIITSIAI